MKNKYLIVTIAIAISFTNFSNAQNTLDYKSLALMKAGNNTKGLYIGDPVAQATAILGTPTSISNQYFEMADATAVVYSYNATKVYFINGVLNSFNVADGSLQVGTVGGSVFKFGDKPFISAGPPPGGGRAFMGNTGFSLYNHLGSINGLKYSYSVDAYVLKNKVNMDLVFGVLYDSNSTIIDMEIAEQ